MARDCVGMILLGSCPIYLLFSWLFLIRAMSARSVFPDTLRWREWISCSPMQVSVPPCLLRRDEWGLFPSNYTAVLGLTPACWAFWERTKRPWEKPVVHNSGFGFFFFPFFFGLESRKNTDFIF